MDDIAGVSDAAETAEAAVLEATRSFCDARRPSIRPSDLAIGFNGLRTMATWIRDVK